MAGEATTGRYHRRATWSRNSRRGEGGPHLGTPGYTWAHVRTPGACAERVGSGQAPRLWRGEGAHRTTGFRPLLSLRKAPTLAGGQQPRHSPRHQGADHEQLRAQGGQVLENHPLPRHVRGAGGGAGAGAGPQWAGPGRTEAWSGRAEPRARGRGPERGAPGSAGAEVEAEARGRGLEGRAGPGRRADARPLSADCRGGRSMPSAAEPGLTPLCAASLASRRRPARALLPAADRPPLPGRPDPALPPHSGPCLSLATISSASRGACGPRRQVLSGRVANSALRGRGPERGLPAWASRRAGTGRTPGTIRVDERAEGPGMSLLPVVGGALAGPLGS